MFSAEHLKSLVEEGRSEFTQQIAQRVASDEATECEDDLRDLILLTPLLLRRLRQLWNQPNIPTNVRRLSGYLFTYLDSPQDVIAEDGHGLLGYVDDAYLVATAYLRAIESLSYTHPLKRGEEQGLLLRTRELLLAARRVLPRETEQIEGMVEALLVGEEQAFRQILASTAGEA